MLRGKKLASVVRKESCVLIQPWVPSPHYSDWGIRSQGISFF